jgi:hypothetical protein
VYGLRPVVSSEVLQQSGAEASLISVYSALVFVLSDSGATAPAVGAPVEAFGCRATSELATPPAVRQSHINQIRAVASGNAQDQKLWGFCVREARI